MRYSAAFDATITSTSLELGENCHTDTTPLVRSIFFHNAEFDVRSNAFALGALLLTRRYCGELVELPAPAGLEYVRAIRFLAPQVESVSPVNGLDRSLSLAERDIVCAPANYGPLVYQASDGVPLISLDWSGDFVPEGKRSSEGYRQGRYFTNAGLIADETTVSIAIALMHSGGMCRNLVVPAPLAGAAAALEPIVAALRTVGISLKFA